MSEPLDHIATTMENEIILRSAEQKNIIRNPGMTVGFTLSFQKSP